MTIYDPYKYNLVKYFIGGIFVIEVSKKIDPHKSSLLSIDANYIAISAYILGVGLMLIPGFTFFAWIIPVLIFALEKKSYFVMDHAIQALGISVFIIIVKIIALIIRSLGSIILYNLLK